MDNDLFRLLLELQLLIKSILLLQLLFNVDATTKFIGTFDATVVGIVVIGNEKAL